MLKKIIIGFCFLFGIFLFENQAQAVDSTNKASKCWTKTACESARAGFGGVPGEGLYTGSDAQELCGKDHLVPGGGKEPTGFCLPAGQSITKISFGGKQTFANFGEFIQYIYRYGMWLAGILAVAFIVISGLQWAASGGNSDMIGSAKNRITGAVTGLILLALSYTILSTINPYLVQLRLPQTWMINRIGMAAAFCSDAKDAKISLFTKSDTSQIEKEKIKATKLAEVESKGYKETYLNAKCGYEYFVDGTSGQTCQGNICGGGICGSAIKDKKLTSNKVCYEGDLIIKFSADMANNFLSQAPFLGIGFAQLKDKWLTNNLVIYGVCEMPNNGVCSSDQTISGGEKIKMSQSTLEGEVLSNYLRIYHGIRDLGAGTFCKDTELKNLKGIIIKTELDENWKFTDPNLYIAIPSSGNNAYIGDFKTVFDKVKAEDSAKVYERLKVGLELNALVTFNMFSKISDEDWSGPNDLEFEELCKNYTSSEDGAEVKLKLKKDTGGFCFLAGTEILTPAGNKKIEMLGTGDEVISYNIEDGSYHIGKIAGVRKQNSEAYYLINHGLLRVTDQHPIYLRKKSNKQTGWASNNPSGTHKLTGLNVMQLEVGDEVFTDNKKWVNITDIVHISKEVETYNVLNVEPYNTYFANGILVHNKI
ncbi:MAG: hypothetical protein A2821_04540 [Candidatus Magasanikbacteria bacterium RIFCSPHIGHO2_01_FULL_41_23]|uniref:Hint domain-containing protein n=1 Tax=Candidatus Magasanikbacteria bacterium RIFCSPLOWO2_01_FULL_40_15 TaxID=1798686 RepID=A0A1F6N4Q3_9BACT|nr:MAG: hypothetical protein A2821_04540 [Candidatus Magasanikbacteria bacterium RIFCSPHIGHO2_01_FULL_41_23]OGH67192.1 MAG: hypothetical protein A3C66_02855 [Candidatus Magasanikbacteria bacterium RIFCSPHIGHO2_02_FULL_41_35]OGH75443.1 MAG: hypothetical protein A3F22_01290 [Candidatus Magasanikbacteria bacterium RIFCSPHIGHO2_12_FULL_41_16]OGH78728.1 MAG: hypothetical protein A2983_04495 [Candidatus Magasanikbacteria bacterium RIFCSPLOWO2_01_FULL_40_15]